MDNGIKMSAKRIAEDSNTFYELVRSCISYYGWVYDEFNSLWVVDNNQYCVTEIALHSASVGGLNDIKWMMDKVERSEIYDFIITAWTYSSESVKMQGFKWFGELIYA